MHVSLHLYNRIGMVLRKMKDYETAEKYYLKALTLTAALSEPGNASPGREPLTAL